MAAHVPEAGIPLTVWNRTPEKCHPLEQAGARVAASLEQALGDADAVVLSLANGPVVEEVLFASGAWERLRPGSVVIDMSSIPPALARQHAERLGDRGVAHLDAPVSGGTTGAAAGTLAVMVGGAEPTFRRCRELLSVFGNPVHVGPPGAGQFAKLCNQIIVGITVAAVSEAMLFARAGGADLAAVREALLGGFADSRILREHGLRMIARDFAPGGVARNQLKDLNTALDVGDASGLQLPITSLARSLFTQLCATREGAELDHTAVLTLLEQMNGITVPTDSGQ